MPLLLVAMPLLLVASCYSYVSLIQQRRLGVFSHGKDFGGTGAGSGEGTEAGSSASSDGALALLRSGTQVQVPEQVLE